MAELKIITMSDVKAESVSWLWKPYIPSGKITIVQGDPGDGKTTLMLAIAANLTIGKSLPNDSAKSSANVIFQTAEDGLADTIKPRLERLGADCTLVHVIDEDEKSLSLSDERIEQAITKKKAKLLILDPLQTYYQLNLVWDKLNLIEDCAFCGKRPQFANCGIPFKIRMKHSYFKRQYLGGADMHSVHGVRPLMKKLAGVADRTDCAIVLIGHLNKSGSKYQYRGLGSIDIYAAARSVLTVGRTQGEENARAVVQGKSNLAPAGASLMFELDPVLGFKWLGECDLGVDDILGAKSGGKSESQFSKARRIIETMLADGYEVAAIRIIEHAEEHGVSYKTLKRAKAELGVISTKCGRQWYWQLPIETTFSEFMEEPQEGQEGQNSYTTLLTPLELKTSEED